MRQTNVVNKAVKMMKIEDIKFEEQIYPRFNKNAYYKWVLRLVDAIKTGADIPPIIVDQYNRIIDGLHRLEAYKLLGYTEVPVMSIEVKDDVDALMKATEYNLHGRSLATVDIVDVALRLQERNVSIDQIARTVKVPAPRLLTWLSERTAAYIPTGELVPLKSPFAKVFGGDEVEDDVVTANIRSVGLRFTSLIHELLTQLDDETMKLSIIAYTVKFPSVLSNIKKTVKHLLEIVETAEKQKTSKQS